jgi:hypothetical protein
MKNRLEESLRAKKEMEKIFDEMFPYLEEAKNLYRMAMVKKYGEAEVKKIENVSETIGEVLDQIIKDDSIFRI